MQLTSLLILLTAVAVAYAQCSSLGTGATSSITGDFTISAYNSVTATTTPLNLVNVVTVPHTSFYILATQAGSVNWQGLTMTNGVITATPPTGSYLSPIISIGNTEPNPDSPFASGPWPTWANSEIAPFDAICSVPNASGGDAILAMYGQTGLFSLCSSYFGPGVSATAILYNASSTVLPDAYSYDGASCTPVTLLVVPS
ncbi:hypothetical protein PHLCEN_2v2918 [Hermanssonia centrifuga]|uniref:Uncharacterized protein n=1 Tax=Hermanssonia centrifuga TaxID=98765 RepID=A0A2R6RIB9_9APHY|nr:hypothetical protein PHLCEN_2v2918 [Hermanssonia centrifuga]